MAEKLDLIPSVANYRFSTALSGTQYLLDVRWNARDTAWYLDVLAEDETPLRLGIKIVLGALLGGRVVSDEFPAGVFIAHDLTNAGTDPGFDELGDRVVVYYYTFEELG